MIMTESVTIDRINFTKATNLELLGLFTLGSTEIGGKVLAQDNIEELSKILFSPFEVLIKEKYDKTTNIYYTSESKSNPIAHITQDLDDRTVTVIVDRFNVSYTVSRETLGLLY